MPAEDCSLRATCELGRISPGAGGGLEVRNLRESGVGRGSQEASLAGLAQIQDRSLKVVCELRRSSLWAGGGAKPYNFGQSGVGRSSQEGVLVGLNQI